MKPLVNEEASGLLLLGLFHPTPLNPPHTSRNASSFNYYYPTPDQLCTPCNFLPSFDFIDGYAPSLYYWSFQNQAGMVDKIKKACGQDFLNSSGGGGLSSPMQLLAILESI